jgi:penicillin-binding protein 2
MVEPDLLTGETPLKAAAPDPRFGLLFWFLVLIMGAIVGRSFQLQIIESERFQLQAEENRVEALPIPAPRGIIYDQRNEQLSINVASTNVILDPVTLPSEENEAPLFDNLPRFIPITPDELRAQISRVRATGQLVILHRALAHEDAITLASALDVLPGVRLESSSARSYPHGAALAHVVGYTSPVGSEEFERRADLRITDSTGKAGIEKQYDEQLRGRNGAIYREVDAQQRPQKELGEEPSVPGADLRLSIDAGLQDYIYHFLETYRPATPNQAAEETDDVAAGQPPVGAVVVLEPASGAIRALVSYPSYNPNVFSQPILREEAQTILSDSAQPLFNRAISGTYAPGSTIKPLLAAAGLAEGLISTQTAWFSSGGIRVGEWFFPDWKAGGHGATDVYKALAESVNTFFYLLVGGDETHQGLGPEVTDRYLSSFAWGKTTGIDLPGEEAGLVPGPGWKERYKNERWYIGDTYHLAIGQGDVLVTPLQVAVATAAIANGGKVPEPFVVEQYTAPDTTVSHEIKTESLGIDSRHLETVRRGMRQAVTEGSARRLLSLPMSVAGKTGTAQIGGTDDTHAWFTSFGPYENPELVVTVLLERAGGGEMAAVPVAEAIWRWWAER